MKGKKFIIGISCIALLGMGAFAYGMVQKNMSSQQSTYFDVVENDKNNTTINSNELTSTLKGSKLEKITGEVILFNYEEEGRQKKHPTSKHIFKNGNEVLEVAYLGEDRKEGLDEIDSASYCIMKDDSDEIYLNMYYSKAGDRSGISGMLNTQMYPESVKEQRDLVNLINDKQEVSDIYEVYYKVAQSIEDDTTIILSEIEGFLGNKSLKKSKDYSNENSNLSLYSHSKDGLNMILIYNEKENKLQDVLLEDNSSNKVSLAYYKNYDFGTQLWKRNKTLQEQEEIINKIVK